MAFKKLSLDYSEELLQKLKNWRIILSQNIALCYIMSLGGNISDMCPLSQTRHIWLKTN